MGEIHAFDTDLKDICKNQEMVHNDVIMDILPIPSMGYLASACMDKKIALWNMKDLSLKHVFVNGH